MKCTVEISMYPLQNDFKNLIIEFIKNLREYSNLEEIPEF